VRPDITVCIPTIPPRQQLLERALASVWAQTLPPAAVAVARDVDHRGVWVTRTRAIQMAQTEWVAQLDDDDELLSHHLEALAAAAAVHGADYVYPGFHTVPAGAEDMLGWFGKPFDPTTITTTTSTVLIRTELARQIRLGPPDPGWTNAQDDHLLLVGALRLGAKVHHHPERTWNYHHHGAHTSGQPHRW
jgi:glycosyltransferase involved in cell wall biosynthesis